MVLYPVDEDNGAKEAREASSDDTSRESKLAEIDESLIFQTAKYKEG